MKHDWAPENPDFYAESWPYCQFIECRRCGGVFCDATCNSDDIMNEECPSSQLDLFGEGQ